MQLLGKTTTRFLITAGLLLGTTASAQRSIFLQQNVASGVTNLSRDFTGGDGDVLSNSGVCYLNAVGAFTIAFWFKTDDKTQTNKYLASAAISGGTQNSIIYGYASSGGDAQIEFFSPGAVGGAPRTGSQITITDTNWHHIAYVYDGLGWSYFLDGTETVIDAAIVFVTSPVNTSCVLTVGNDPTASSSVNGAMARFYMSTSALTDMQIATMAGATCSTSGVAGTVGYWPLNAGASPEPEASPSGATNSLTVTGATTTTGPSCSSQ